MRNRFRIAVAVLTALVGMTQAYLKSYEVEPVNAQWSGWTRRDGWVGNIITCNFDSAVRVDLFVGYVGDTSHHYNVEIRNYETGERVAYKNNVSADRDHKWLRFDLEPVAGQKFVRGKKYLVKFTRPGDSIHCYFNPNDPYPYGGFVAQEFSESIVVATTDLCMRVYGVMDTVDSGPCRSSELG